MSKKWVEFNFDSWLEYDWPIQISKMASKVGRMSHLSGKMESPKVSSLLRNTCEIILEIPKCGYLCQYQHNRLFLIPASI